ncbi:expressed unknown protein [Seminavis robusta]|uniref:Uncharacterized protein n=1 Tax=Seminavis robusta TaxID=568900 RepID=A0A9N8EU18_9STRA|nr:expressed unknown protein [Seminavis robusta]|eukprot:Sro1950_g307370.1 n/a (232) ;mRNA; r:7680-8375
MIHPSVCLVLLAFLRSDRSSAFQAPVMTQQLPTRAVVLSDNAPSCRSQRRFTTHLSAAEFGELSISEPSRPTPSIVTAAQAPLPWEEEKSHHNDDENWQDGQLWSLTRQRLMDIWVLPRDMSNGSWEPYAMAASAGEEALLQKAPQLLRLSHTQVLEAAKTITRTLRLPPAVLRREPMLLTMNPTQLIGGYNRLLLEHDAIRDEPHRLVQAATEWAREDNNGHGNNSSMSP